MLTSLFLILSKLTKNIFETIFNQDYLHMQQRLKFVTKEVAAARTNIYLLMILHRFIDKALHLVKCGSSQFQNRLGTGKQCSYLDLQVYIVFK